MVSGSGPGVTRASFSAWASARAASIAIWVLATVLLVLVDVTGCGQSSLTPALLLPVVLGAALGRVWLTVCQGVYVAVGYLFLAHPDLSHMPSSYEVIRALTTLLVAVIGARMASQANTARAVLQHTVEQSETLLNVSQVINSSDNLEPAVNSVLLLLRTLLPKAQTLALFLTDEAGRTMSLASVLGAAPSDLRFERFSLVVRQRGWNPEDLDPLYLPDAHRRPEVRMAKLDKQARSVVCVGLRSQSKVVGMLFVAAQRSHAFSAEQVRTLKVFADRIAYPLQQLRMQEGLRGLAYSDGLTGLANFRSFGTQLADELKRSVRYRRPLSLIMLDLDDFKAVNDRYGHPEGDRVLAGTAAAIRSTVRETDVAARYGGEEFVVICPETTVEDAVTVAKRVRVSVEKARFTMSNGETCAITISAGVASYPRDGRDPRALIAAADLALYRAKGAGKNAVMSSRAEVAER